MRERRYGVKRVGGGGSGGDEGGETGQNIFYEKLFIFTKNNKKIFLKIKMKVKGIMLYSLGLEVKDRHKYNERH